MHAISLWQPYASLIADRVKTKETRSWYPHREALGKRIAIHASKRKPTRSEYDSFPQEIHDAMIGNQGLFWMETIPYGAFVATAILDYVFTVERFVSARTVKGMLTRSKHGQFHSEQREMCVDVFGDFSVGRKIWGLSDIKKLDTPVPAVGRQGLWRCELKGEI